MNFGGQKSPRVPNTAPSHHDMLERDIWIGGGRVWGSFFTARLRDDPKMQLFEEILIGGPQGFSHHATRAYGPWLDGSPYYRWFDFKIHRMDDRSNIEFEFPVGLVTASAAILPLIW